MLAFDGSLINDGLTEMKWEWEKENFVRKLYDKHLLFELILYAETRKLFATFLHDIYAWEMFSSFTPL